MATNKKNYTLTDVYNKLSSMDGRLVTVEKWKDGIEIGKAAVDEYKRQEATNNRDGIFSSLKDGMPYILMILAGAATLIFAYASRAK